MADTNLCLPPDPGLAPCTNPCAPIVDNSKDLSTKNSFSALNEIEDTSMIEVVYANPLFNCSHPSFGVDLSLTTDCEGNYEDEDENMKDPPSKKKGRPLGLKNKIKIGDNVGLPTRNNNSSSS